MTSWDNRLSDSAFVRAYEAARRRYDESVTVLCAWGLCEHQVYRGRIIGGIGPLACPCDHLPGWRSTRVQGQAKPRVPVKAAGRHRSRIERSIRRHKLPAYLARLTT